MMKPLALLVFAITVVGVMAFAPTNESASAQVQLPDGPRYELQCSQILAPNDPDNLYPGIGVVRCQLLIDLPDRFAERWHLQDPLELTVYGGYRDVDGNNRPSPGDRLLCIRVVAPGGFTWERCRPGIVVPPDFALPE